MGGYRETRGNIGATVHHGYCRNKVIDEWNNGGLLHSSLTHNILFKRSSENIRKSSGISNFSPIGRQV